MKPRFAFIGVLLIAALVAGLSLSLGGSHIVLFHPAGYISAREVALMSIALRLMLLVVVPVFLLTFYIAWHFRASNTKARYLPNWDHNAVEEAIWWAVPCLIIVVLATITWSTTHELDPYRPLAADAASTTPLTVQVVSLDWKWLFIYPKQGIATVNYLAFPQKTPVAFQLTSDAPMNAFWIPQLGGQEMTMPGMVTQLHLMADATGTFTGLSSNYSGEGFAGMQFPVHSMTDAQFHDWVAKVKQTPQTLDYGRYEALAKPSRNDPPVFFNVTDPNLYTRIVMQFMTPTGSSTTSAAGADMSGMRGMGVPEPR